MTGYIRNDTSNNIANGNVVNASDLDGEFDAIQAAFDASTGHTHDGSVGGGSPIAVLGPAQDIVVTSSVVRPKTNNTVDLGTSTLEFKDLYIDGTANIDSLVADTADINGGTVDNATIATSNITVGAGKTLDVSAGTLTLADNQISGDKVEGGTIAAITINTLGSTTVNSTTVDTTNLEVTTLKAKDGTAAGSIADTTGVVTLASSVLTTADINGGTIDGTVIGGATPAAGSFTSLGATGNITVGGTVDGRDVAADGTKLDGIEAGADVTDTTNVTAAGALMDSELTNITAIKALNQGVATTDSPSFAAVTVDNINLNGNTISSTNTNGDITLDPNGTGNVIVASGNVGIGTGSPAAQLHIAGQVNGTLRVDTTASGYLDLSMYNNGAFLGTSASQPLRFGTANTERARIDASGNVGIGTTSPSAKLHVAGSVVIGNANAYNELVFSGAEYTNLYSETTSGFDIGTNSTSGSSYLRLLTENTERARIDSSGNLGLGVTPSAWGNSGYAAINAKGNASFLGLNAGGTNTQTIVGNNWYDAGLGSPTYIASNFATSYTQVGGTHSWFTAPSGTAGNAITFTQAMTLDASGKLGVGTTSPGDTLDINGGIFTTPTATDNTGTANIGFQSNRSSSTQPRGSLSAIGSSASTNYQALKPGYLTLYSAYADIALNADTSKTIQFWTGGSERARIDSSGNLLVGTTSDLGGLGGKVQIASGASRGLVQSVNANVRMQEYLVSGSTVGFISNNGSSTTYSTTSDYRLKENVQPMQNALDTVARLNPVTYNWKADGSESQGFIAHELQAVVPECVTGEKDAMQEEQYEVSPAVPATYDDEGNVLTEAVEAVTGTRMVPAYQGIDTSFLVATLTKAIQEQQAIIADLTARVAALEA